MMKWYELKADSDESSRKVVSFLKTRRLMVRRVDGSLYACIGTEHQRWLSDVCKDFSTTFIALDEMPKGLRMPKREKYVAPCGEEFYDPMFLSNHHRFCPKCSALRKEVPKEEEPTPEVETKEAKPGAIRKVYAERAPRATTVAVIEPGLEFTLNGVVTSLEATRDKLFSQLEIIEGLLTNLKQYQEMKGQIMSLDSEVKGRINAVRLLVQDGKVN